jgi:hypothetical protein
VETQRAFRLHILETLIKRRLRQKGRANHQPNELNQMILLFRDRRVRSAESVARCPTIVMESLDKLKEILAENKYEFNKRIHSA